MFCFGQTSKRHSVWDIFQILLRRGFLRQAQWMVIRKERASLRQFDNSVTTSGGSSSVDLNLISRGGCMRLCTA